jgi:predicted enzyme related to lactoylglutathione lyase
MSNADPQGKFVWHELLTSDSAAATAFYTRVVPWKTQAWEQDSSYTMWVGKNGPVGGVASLGDSSAPHWLPFIGVADVAATVAAAKDAGASVVKDATSLPNKGVYAVLADPQGAEFGIHATPNASNGSPAPGAGDFSWHELSTSDAKSAMDFYSKLFGWEVGPVHDMGDMGHYHLFLRDGNQYGGMYVSNGEGGPSWLCYVSVEDAGKAAAAAKAAGGRVVNGPMEVPGGSWVATVLDKEGASFAVHEQAKSAVAAEKPAKAAKPKAPKAAKPAEAAAAAPAAEVASEPAPKPSVAKPAAPKKSAPKPPAAKPAAEAASAAKPAAKAAPAKPAAKKAAKKAKKAAPAKAKAPAKKAGKKVAKKAAKKVAKKAAKKSAAKGKAKKAAGKKSAPAKKKAKAKKK